MEMNSIQRYFLYHYPHLPGGIWTVGAIVVTLLVLLALYKRTHWGGWMAFFYSIAFYTIPVLTEYHKR